VLVGKRVVEVEVEMLDVAIGGGGHMLGGDECKEATGSIVPHGLESFPPAVEGKSVSFAKGVG